MTQQLTVGELIDQLSTFDRDGLVHLEGCDCYTKAVIVEEYNSDEPEDIDVLIRQMDSYNEEEEVRNAILRALKNGNIVEMESINGAPYCGRVHADYGDTFGFTLDDESAKRYQIFYSHIKKVTHV